MEPQVRDRARELGEADAHVAHEERDPLALAEVLDHVEVDAPLARAELHPERPAEPDPGRDVGEGDEEGGGALVRARDGDETREQVERVAARGGRGFDVCEGDVRESVFVDQQGHRRGSGYGSMPDMSDVIETIELALEAGSSALRARFGLLVEGDIEEKGELDLVTVADRESEAAVLAVLRGRHPEHAVLAEESGGDRTPRAGGRWIVDPLDGTTNFTHGVPLFSVSIALEVDGVIVAGGVESPILGERFLAERGAGATRNGRRIAVSRAATLERALLVTGFPYDRRARIDHYLAPFRAFLLRAQGVLRLGSAALDLSAVACGRLDAFWEEGLSPWDTAAGMLLVEEAGGAVSDFRGGRFSPFGRETLASNGLLHDACVEVLALPPPPAPGT